MTSNFKKMNNSNISKKKIDELKHRHPDRVPVIVCDVKNVSNKFIVPINMNVAEFLVILRKKVDLTPQESIYIFIKKNIKNTNTNTQQVIIPATSLTIGTIYSEHKDENGILNLIYDKEAVFGFNQ